MKRIPFRALVLVVASVPGAETLQAQHVHVSIGGGVIIPMSAYGANDDVGWHVLGRGEASLPVSRMSIRVAALYGETTHKGGVAGASRLGGASGDLVWHPPLPRVLPRLDLLGGIGFYHVTVDATGLGSLSESKVAFDGGVGLSAGLRNATFFGEARFISVRTSGDATSFIPISVGVSFSLR
jgi:hypothetical protein